MDDQKKVTDGTNPNKLGTYNIPTQVETVYGSIGFPSRDFIPDVTPWTESIEYRNMSIEERKEALSHLGGS